MPDREKVIKGLECCTKWDSCSDCPYQTPNEYDISECTEPLHKDALALLIEQEAVEPTWSRGKPYCGSCGKQIRNGGEFCSECGKPIAWEGR